MRRARFAPSFLLAATTLVCAAGFAPAAGAQATITGRVMAEASKEPLAEVRVLVVGTNAAAVTTPDGRYRLSNVRTGTVEVQVLRVGYQSQKKTASTTAGGSSTLDFAMVVTVVKLDEMVTTATGQQRKVELGNALATINAAKLAEEAPIRDMSDLLVARAPSVSVTPGTYTGAAAQIRIRGLSSISNSGPPIYIVDGIRINAGTGVGLTGGGAQSSRLNDILPQDIEDIEIVRGPSAATLYGTNAANGVVVITTKRGKQGHTNWTIQSEGGIIADRNQYPNTYANWGHKPGTDTLMRCNLWTISDGSCAHDSLTTANLLATAGLTPIALGNRNLQSLQVSGGQELVRFFASGTFETEVGALKMPDFSKQRLDSLRVPIRNEWIRPSQSQHISLRSNINTSISPKIDLGITTSYLKVDNRGAPSDNNVNSYYYNALTSPGFVPKDPKACVTTPARCLGFSGIGSLGQDLHGYGGFTPGEIFQQYTNEDVQRLGGTVSLRWQPLTWLQNDATTGVDLTAGNQVGHCYLSECADFGTQRQGSYSENHSNNRQFSAKLTSTGTWQARNWLNLKTSLGGEYLNQESEGTNVSVSVLGPGVQSVGLGSNRSGSNTAPTATKTLGLFVQEQMGFRDRMFLTGAVRTDQNSAFGTKFQRVYYPKGSLSWQISDEPFFRNPRGLLDEVRLRVAYGESGIQPGSTDALDTFSSSTVRVANIDESALAANQIGNSRLRPERTLEWEGGMDVRMLTNRVNMELTYYSKQTRDAIENYNFAPSAGAASSVTYNLGGVKNAGVEASVTTTVLDRRSFGWDVTVGGSHNKNKVVYLGFVDGVPIPQTPRTSVSRTLAGYPLGGQWFRGYTWNDDNGDKLITPNEVHPEDLAAGDSSDFVGPQFPTDLVNISTGFDLLNRKLRINILANYSGGYNKFNNTQQFLCAQTVSCWASQNQDASLADQARQVASNIVVPATLRTTRGYSENLNFWRLREITANYQLPDALAMRLLRSHAVNAIFGMRNLHVWSSYTGEDPEANYSTGNSQTDLLTAGPPTIYTLHVNVKY